MNKLYDVVELLIAVSIPIFNAMGIPVPYYTWGILLVVRFVQYIFRSAESELTYKKLTDLKNFADIFSKLISKKSIDVPLNNFYTK